MKKSTLLLLLPLALAGACKPDRAKVKKDFVASCLQAAKDHGAAGVPDAWLKESCDCSADRVLDNATDAELQALADQDPAAKERAMSLAQPCVDELQKKIASGQH